MEDKSTQRDSFIFYRSFYEAMEGLDDKTKLEIFNAICELSLNFKEKKLQGISKSIMTLIKPQVLANNKRFVNGKKPKQKQNVSKTEAKPKQDRSKQEANKKQNISKTEAKRKQNRSKVKAKPKQSGSKTEANVNVNVNVNDNVNENPNVNANENVFEKTISSLTQEKQKLLSEWLSYRKELKKPIKIESTIKKLVEKFKMYSLSEIKWVVAQSIENNYQGLFWEKAKNHKMNLDEKGNVKQTFNSPII